MSLRLPRAAPGFHELPPRNLLEFVKMHPCERTTGFRELRDAQRPGRAIAPARDQPTDGRAGPRMAELDRCVGPSPPAVRVVARGTPPFLRTPHLRAATSVRENTHHGFRELRTSAPSPTVRENTPPQHGFRELPPRNAHEFVKIHPCERTTVFANSAPPRRPPRFVKTHTRSTVFANSAPHGATSVRENTHPQHGFHELRTPRRHVGS